jgi:hypothetical protein
MTTTDCNGLIILKLNKQQANEVRAILNRRATQKEREKRNNGVLTKRDGHLTRELIVYVVVGSRVDPTLREGLMLSGDFTVVAEAGPLQIMLKQAVARVVQEFGLPSYILEIEPIIEQLTYETF